MLITFLLLFGVFCYFFLLDPQAFYLFFITHGACVFVVFLRLGYCGTQTEEEKRTHGKN